MKTQSIGKAFSQMGIKAKQQKARERREQVKALKAKGLSGQQIADALGVKLRTVYQDFSILKRESEAENE